MALRILRILRILKLFRSSHIETHMASFNPGLFIVLLLAGFAVYAFAGKKSKSQSNNNKPSPIPGWFVVILVLLAIFVGFIVLVGLFGRR